MEENKNIEFQLISDKLDKVRKYLSEERKSNRPSPSVLERGSLEIISILNESKFTGNGFTLWKSSNITKLKIYKADLVGILYDDYDKHLDRYGNKWKDEKTKIDNLIIDFEEKFGN